MGVKRGSCKNPLATILLLAFAAVGRCAEVPEPPPVMIDYFYEPGCPECLQIEGEIVPMLKMRYEGLCTLRRHDIRFTSNVVTLVRYQETLGVSDNTPVSMFVDYSRPLLGLKAIREGLFSSVDECVVQRLDPEWTPPAPIEAGKLEDAQSRVSGFAIGAVLAAGLFDGLNPCAIATLVLFVSLLVVYGRKRGALLLMGVPFCIGSFATYTAIGFGLLACLHSLDGFPLVRRSIEVILAVGLMALASLSFRDAVRYAQSHDADAVLVKLPSWAERWIHLVARRGVKSHHLVLAGLGTGIAVTGLEAVCTGQVYVPALVVVAGSTDGAVAWRLLLLYNTMFILPLVAALVLARFGLTSETMVRWSKRNVPFSKTLLGLFFLAVAVYLLI